MNTQSTTTSSAALRPAGRLRPRRLLLLGALSVSAALLLWRSDFFWNALSPVTNKAVLYKLAGRTKVDPLLLAAIVRAESGFDPAAQSPRGALGLMQLMPSTARQMAGELKFNYQDQDDLYTQDINLTLGAFYFARQLKNFHGNLVLALAAYNAGPAKVRAWNLDPWGRDQDDLISALPLPTTRSYVRHVLWYYRQFKNLQAVKRFLHGDSEL
ncbi:MAG TPA: lytic transglycosylase domain-containing protein [bacterium]|nr:lytic transglycosylase domain-containing protein [bacterium]